MFTIHKIRNYLLVELHRDFDYTSLQMMLCRVMRMPEFRCRNDIWLIGSHHAHLHMDELKAIVDDVMILYPENAERDRTALVIEPGLTRSIAEMFIDGGKGRLPFKMKTFSTLTEAQGWIGVPEECVA